MSRYISDHDDRGRDHRALMRDSERDFDTRFPVGIDEPDPNEGRVASYGADPADAPTVARIR